MTEALMFITGQGVLLGQGSGYPRGGVLKPWDERDSLGYQLDHITIYLYLVRGVRCGSEGGRPKITDRG